jgi:hypothetical protein
MRVTLYLTAEFRYNIASGLDPKGQVDHLGVGIRQVPSCSPMGFLISINIQCIIIY